MNIKGGLKLDTPKDTDYIFGAFSPFPYEVLQLNGDWKDYLPTKELQDLNNIEPYACVTFTVLNCVEMLIRRKYGEERNYSDRFLANISGTREGGNSPRTVCDYLRKVGVVPESVWSFGSDIDSFEKFYEEIPQDIKDMAKEFLDEWDFGYDMVPSYEEEINLAIKTSPLLISVSAWHERDGKYYRPQGMTDNHATTMIAERPGEYRQVFDTYEPIIKDVEWDAIPMQVMRFHIKKKDRVIPQPYWFTEMFRNLLEFGKDIVIAFINNIKKLCF